jgi:hypothetical protein
VGEATATLQKKLADLVADAGAAMGTTTLQYL